MWDRVSEILLPLTLVVCLVGCNDGGGGSVTCEAPFELCGSVCVNTETSSDHCGTCGNACDTGEFCVDGECSNATCDPGETDCGGECVELDSDLEHCGSCGNDCAAGEVCSAGECSTHCGAGLTVCDGICRDTQTDRNNCGECGETCDPGEVCSSGDCGLQCGGSTPTRCGDACIDTMTNSSYCGADSTTCEDGEVCGAGEVCSAGECGLTCGHSTPTRCGDACVDTSTDRIYCGADSVTCEGGETCAVGEFCSDGVCDFECTSGLEECGDACIDTDHNPSHCGECDNPCDPGEACYEGDCGTVPTDDSDSDTISDYHEGRDAGLDTDGDGTADYLDDDSDGDGISDADEAGDAEVRTPPLDSDGDTIPDFQDLDSDNDGLSDELETTLGTDPIDADSDDDGESDGVEVAGGSDPLDAADTVSGSGGFTFDLEPGGVDRTDTLQFDPAIQRADVLFLIDTTGSMSGEINNLQASLATVVSDISGTIPDAAFGVARFDDFPTGGYGYATCGSESDYPFELEQRVTTDMAAITAGVDALDTPLHCGADGPESQIEGLYQAATGEGFRSPSGTYWSDPFDPDAGYDASAGHGRIGGAGFRTDALPIIVLATDNTFHRHWSDGTVAAADRATWCGDSATDTCDLYSSTYFGSAADQQPKTWADTLDALNTIHARVIGIVSEGTSGSDWRTELSGFAVRTGTWIEPTAGMCATGLSGADRPTDNYDPDGAGPDPAQDLCPLVYSVSSTGSGLSGTVSDAIMDLVSFVSFSTMHTEARDNPSTPGIDESLFFVRGIPVSADPSTCTPLPTVADRIPAVGDGTFDSFVDVEPGCLVTFQIVARNDGFVPQMCEDQLFNLDVIVIGDDVVEADRRTVVVRVPGHPSFCTP